MSVDPSAVFETTWWEYVLNDDGSLKYGEWKDGIRSPLLRSLATGEVRTSRDLPTGALYAAKDVDGYVSPKGYDGLSIRCVHADGHHWNIEGRASNCTMKEDYAHRCWVRHGTVGDRLTVDKAGLTCAAGAGSFFMGDNNEWHGFLRNGRMTP